MGLISIREPNGEHEKVRIGRKGRMKIGKKRTRN